MGVFVDGEVNRKANAVRVQAVENVPAIIQTTRELITIKTTTTGNQPSTRRLLSAVFFG